MAPICGIEADTLREVARAYARAESAIIFWGMGVSQHTHGTDNARCLIALALITGQIGRPGTGLHPLRGQNNVQGASDAGLIPMFFPDYKSVEDPEIRGQYEKAWGVKLPPKRGKTVVEIMDAVHADEIKGMYIEGENPAMSDPDLNHARAGAGASRASGGAGPVPHRDRGLCRRDPAGLRLAGEGRHRHQHQPPGADGPRRRCRCRAIRARISGSSPRSPTGMGCGWNYKHVGEVFNEMASMMPALDNITWERVEREYAVTYPVDGPDVPGRDVVFDKGFPRPGGFAKLVATKLQPPDEVPDAEYPFILSTGRQLEHWHTGSMTRRATVLDRLEPSAIAQLSRGTIEKLGIAAGRHGARHDAARHGRACSARQDDAVPDGVVFIPFAYVEAAANLLDQSEARSVRQDPGVQVLRRARSRRSSR